MWGPALAVLVSAVALSGQPGTVMNRHPTWSPDGNWIAFDRRTDTGSEIWKTDGVHVRRIVAGGDEPSWSPDGRRIAFRDAKGRLAIVSAAGGRPEAIAPAPIGWPVWGPHGRSIAFDALYGGCGDGYSLMAVRPDGRFLEVLVGGDEFDEYFAPVWSPDAKRLSFVFGQGESLNILDLRNGNYLTLGGAKHPGRATWSPDGKFLVFVNDRTTPSSYYDAPDGYGPIFTIDVSTQKMRRVTGTWGNGPVWSPRGKRIAFAAQTKDGSTQIFLVSPNGSNLVQLTKA